MSGSLSSRLPPGKRAAYAVLCIALPLLVVGGLEGGLRLAGWGGQTPMIREAAQTPDGTLMIVDPDGAKPYFFAGPPEQTGSAVTGQFWSPKPVGTFRVFLLGGSAIQGFPQPRHLRVSAFLEAILADVLPEWTVEVINFGATAVASFPVSNILEQALPYEPDLVVIYTGHNEFFGAYGLASSHRAGSRPWMQRLQHRGRNLALVQAARSAMDRAPPDTGETHHLMEAMIGEARVAPDSWRRRAAARCLQQNLERMIRTCRDAGVPAMVCTLPSNERDLAPIGAPDLDGLSATALQTLENASNDWADDPARAAEPLAALVAAAPQLAQAHYHLGRALEASGDSNAAAREFVLARDLDPMPWRATSRIQQAVRDAAAAEGAALCDVEAAFRRQTGDGIIGWDLMDDHVHPSLRGQALIAETMARALPGVNDPAPLPLADLARLRKWEEYAAELGDNPYDRYGVQRWAVKIFSIPFMKAANPAALDHFAGPVRAFEEVQPEYLRRTLRQWRSTPPICFQVALALMQHGRNAEALPLLRIAGRATPPYSPGSLACTYYELSCTEIVHGALSAADRAVAGEAIARGKLMRQGGAQINGARERFMGRLHYLRDEYSQAIPYLLAARAGASGQNRAADDQALFNCYRRSGRLDEARALAAGGARSGGPLVPVYQGWLRELDAAQE